MSKVCEKSRTGAMQTNFEKVKAFINRGDVDCNDCSISNTSLDNISVTSESIKGRINAEMSKTLQKMGFKTPFMKVKRWIFQSLYDNKNFEIIGYFDDATETTVYIRGFLNGYGNTENPADEENKALIEALNIGRKL